jgi:molecular chaperone GrpE (heat shock protein)
MRYLKIITLLLGGTVATAFAQAQQAQPTPKVILGSNVVVNFDTKNDQARASILLDANVAQTSFPLKCSYVTDDWFVTPIAGARSDKDYLLLEQTNSQIDVVHLVHNSLPAAFVLTCATKSGHTSIPTTILAQSLTQGNKTGQDINPSPSPARGAGQLSQGDSTGGVQIARIPIWMWIIVAVLALLLICVLGAPRLFRPEMKIADPPAKIVRLEPGKECSVKIKRPKSYQVNVKASKLDWKEAPEHRSRENNDGYYRITLSLESSLSSGAEIVEFTVWRRFFPSAKLELFVWWEISKPVTVEQMPPAQARHQQTVFSNPNKVLEEIESLRAEFQRQTDTLNQLKQSMTQIDQSVTTVSDAQTALYTSHDFKELKDSLAVLLQKVSEGPEQITSSMLLTVNQVFAKSLSTMQKQIKDDSDSQRTFLAGLVNQGHTAAKEAFAGTRAENGSPQLSQLDSFVSEKVINGDVSSLVRIFASPVAGDGVNLRPMAQNFGELAATVEEIESRFVVAGGKAPPLVSQIRGRLLRLEWLAQKYDSFRRNHSLPVEIRLECTEGGLQKLPKSLATGIETALQYWRVPKEFLEKNLDDVVTRELTEVVRLCDDAAQNLKTPELFDDLLRKLFKLTCLEDISPRPGGAYDSTGHNILGFEPGNRDTITRIVVRGFRYKQALLQKPTVMVGQ